MYTLGIETTCDETAASIVKNGKDVLSNEIYSQINIHKQFNGVFPELASRSHVEKIIFIIDKAINKAKIQKDQIDLIAVAHGPGLLGSILVGLNAAKALSLAWEKPLVGVNHIEAHLFASMMDLEKVLFPSLGIVLSGGHSEIIEIESIGKYRSIGKTIDDAIGEAFDKVATMLGLPYPGGPEIERLAKLGDADKYLFSSGKDKTNPLNFSFSGLKTKLLYTIKGQKGSVNDPDIVDEDEKKHIAASFQKAIYKDVIEKTSLALKKNVYSGIFLGGGVTDSQTLRQMFNEEDISIPLHWPKPGFSLDNAVMIAALGYQKYIRTNKADTFDLSAQTRIPLV